MNGSPSPVLCSHPCGSGLFCLREQLLKSPVSAQFRLCPLAQCVLLGKVGLSPINPISRSHWWTLLLAAPFPPHSQPSDSPGEARDGGCLFLLVVPAGVLLSWLPDAMVTVDDLYPSPLFTHKADVLGHSTVETLCRLWFSHTPMLVIKFNLEIRHRERLIMIIMTETTIAAQCSENYLKLMNYLFLEFPT